MNNSLFSLYAPVIQGMSLDEIESEVLKPNRLQIEATDFRGKRLEVAYAPFDFVNHNARVVIVGMTPGRQQMRNAIIEARRLLLAGSSLSEAVQGAKVFASFSGAMRVNLVQLLDAVGVHTVVGIPTTAALWNGNSSSVHFTSALRYPVFVNGANYSGAPDMVTTPFLANQLRAWFGSEMADLSTALFVPLGPKVGAALKILAKEVGINPAQVLSGLPHPSGANGERIAYFLGRKHRSTLSAKTNPGSLDAARDGLLRQIASLKG